MRTSFMIGMVALGIAVITSIMLVVYQPRSVSHTATPTGIHIPSPSPSSNPSLPLVTTNQPSIPSIEVIANSLDIPWEIAFLPDKTMLVTERPGRLLKITTDRTVIPISGVTHTGEGGLLGLAIHPQFSTNHWIYVYLTTQTPHGLFNTVKRFRLEGTTLQDAVNIVENIPGSSFHDGGRLAFGPDGLLYITTGDAGNEQTAQDTSSLAGKILRVHDDGSLPDDNPFHNAVYSYGHRNVQGIAWDTHGQLWATEHGRSGIRSGFDEINRIEKGNNYGWPVIEGDETHPGMIPPILHSGAQDTWAPSGAAILNNSLFFAGLRGEALYQATLTPQGATNLIMHFKHDYGRLRTVTVGPDGLLYMATNNRDGRGTPHEGDDSIIRINPSLFQ